MIRTPVSIIQLCLQSDATGGHRPDVLREVAPSLHRNQTGFHAFLQKILCNLTLEDLDAIA